MAVPPGFVKEESTLPPGFVKETPGEDFFGSGVVEPGRAIVSGLLRTVAGGLSGLGAQAIPGGRTGAEQVEAFTQGSFVPQTESGQRNLQRLGDLAQFGIDVVNFPVSGLAGLTELLTGQGTLQASRTVENVQDDGAGVTFGERVFEETGSPLAASIARIAPEGVAELGTLPFIPRSLSTLKRVAEESAVPIANVIRRQSPTQQRIAEMIGQGSENVETAGFRVEELTPSFREQEVAALPGPQASALPESASVSPPLRLVKDPLQQEAVRQGFNEGLMPVIREASPTDRAKMLEMLDIRERGNQNLRFQALNRPADVAGNTVLERFNFVLEKNQEAGQALDEAASQLRGQRVNASEPVNNFLEGLESIGVTLDDELKPVFAGSDIQASTGAQNLINQVVDRMRRVQTVDAFELHRLKRLIDEQVTFGKMAEGLGGRAESIVKSFRREIDQLLDSNFETYNQVNTQYADTINAIDSLQNASGTKVNLTGDNADKAMGTVLRRLLSNTQSRVNLLDSINELEGVATKYGANLQDDVIAQLMFVDELESVFGPVGRTTFQGQIAQAIPTSRSELFNQVVERSIESVRGVNDEAAFNAMRALLGSF